ncbi:MAG TPA: very short patch repair endonuclease, partial [Kribbella sp.]|uniref:very short patch repair endonuclease n=1 Tax=Kribbella sp. TaxID=1871183 RepID=UPI002D78D1D9
MQRQRTRDTGPELAVRRLLHSAGLRYRVDVAPLEGLRRRADVVFARARVAVFVDGCFWHGCPRHGSRATTANSDYWKDKTRKNQARDADTDANLQRAGWLSIRAWEHESPQLIAEAVVKAVRTRTSAPG